MFYHRAQCYRLAFGIIFRMAGWGIILGAMLGGLSGFLLGAASPTFILVFIIGALAGGASGLILGLATGCTLVLFSVHGMPTDGKGYLRIARAISIFWIIIGAIAIGLLLHLRPEDLPVYAIIIVPGSIAAGAAWWACAKVVTWVEQELQ
jgi:hypothetical protein